VFPYLAFDIASEEWHPWQVIDSTAFRHASIADSLAEILRHARTHLHASPAGRWFDPASASPTPQEVVALVATLRPRFELVESRKQRRLREEEELLELTHEQYDALDAMDANARVVFEGPAGTGKTLLALEAARRSSITGHRVLLACFNRALGKWIREQAGELGEGSFVGTLSSYMLKTSGLDASGRGSDPAFWNEELPSAALDEILAGPSSSAFDEVIIDEAQDLLRQPFLDVLDVSLKGGVGAGRWRIFGDFERQALYGRHVSLDTFLEKHGSKAPVHSLRVNCRNTPRIAALTRLLAGLTPDYRRIRRPDDGVEPNLVFFEPGEERLALIGALQRCYTQGYSGPDIVVLSASARDPLASRIEDQPWSDRLQPMEAARPGGIRYCTIHSFKGLEAPVVIVTDLDEVEGDEAQSLLYVALTRALDRLVVLFPKAAAAKVAARVSRVAEELSDAR
jgi:hypothetical protein